MAHPSVSTPARADTTSGSGCKASKLTCLCSPTNHPGSFRCGRHRTRPLPSSSIVRLRASQKQAAAPVIKSGGGSRTTGKGRPVLRAHLLQRLLVSPPPSSRGSDHRRCREFKPRLSRLGRLAAASS